MALHSTILSIVNKILYYLILCNYEVKGLATSNIYIINLGIIVMINIQSLALMVILILKILINSAILSVATLLKPEKYQKK